VTKPRQPKSVGIGRQHDSKEHPERQKRREREGESEQRPAAGSNRTEGKGMGKVTAQTQPAKRQRNSEEGEMVSEHDGKNACQRHLQCQPTKGQSKDGDEGTAKL
jgi:hypothetical protein